MSEQEPDLATEVELFLAGERIADLWLVATPEADAEINAILTDLIAGESEHHHEPGPGNRQGIEHREERGPVMAENTYGDDREIEGAARLVRLEADQLNCARPYLVAMLRQGTPGVDRDIATVLEGLQLTTTLDWRDLVRFLLTIIRTEREDDNA